jgi:hypothetical protein
VRLLGDHSLFCGAKAVSVLGYPCAARRRSIIRHWSVKMYLHYGVIGSTPKQIHYFSTFSLSKARAKNWRCRRAVCLQQSFISGGRRPRTLHALVTIVPLNVTPLIPEPVIECDPDPLLSATHPHSLPHKIRVLFLFVYFFS